MSDDRPRAVLVYDGDPKAMARTYIERLRIAAKYWKVQFDLKKELDAFPFLTDSDRAQLLEALSLATPVGRLRVFEDR